VLFDVVSAGQSGPPQRLVRGAIGRITSASAASDRHADADSSAIPVPIRPVGGVAGRVERHIVVMVGRDRRGQGQFGQRCEGAGVVRLLNVEYETGTVDDCADGQGEPPREE